MKTLVGAIHELSLPMFFAVPDKVLLHPDFMFQDIIRNFEMVARRASRDRETCSIQTDARSVGWVEE